MRINSAKKLVLNPESKPYIRIAGTPAPTSSLSLFYIGSDKEMIASLSENFTTVFFAENFDAATKLIRSKKFTNQVDAVLADVKYEEPALKELQTTLRTKGVHYTTPIIFNVLHCQNKAEFLLRQNMIDDVIDLHNWQYDLSNKISFLKKAKEHSFLGKDNIEVFVRPRTFFFKRLFDIVAASILILLTLPLFLIIAIAIKMEDRGPLFYNAKRAGRGFKIFRFYKFRTMEINADKKVEALSHLNQYGNGNNALFFKITNDPRITKVGKFLRNTSLDELPQLFNVLKGDMSLVGNRPLPLYEAATLTTNEFVERFMAPAGITGLWQIKKRGQSEMSVEERISLDISYARKSSLAYDFWIMAHTPAALFQKTNV